MDGHADAEVPIEHLIRLIGEIDSVPSGIGRKRVLVHVVVRDQALNCLSERRSGDFSDHLERGERLFVAVLEASDAGDGEPAILMSNITHGEQRHSSDSTVAT